MTASHDKPDLHHVFTQKCLEHFRYLVAYGCELTSIEEDRYAVEITYKNQTTAIKVSFEFRENQIFVYLIRLINGEIPAYLDAPSCWFYLDNLVKLRSSSTTLPRKKFGDWLTPDDIDDILTAYASALKEYGEDLLRGDFSVFVELVQQIDRPESSSIDEVRSMTQEQAIAAELTPREQEILQALAEGLSRKEIADRMHISVATERTHMMHILAKLGVDYSGLQALVFAIRHDPVEADRLPEH